MMAFSAAKSASDVTPIASTGDKTTPKVDVVRSTTPPPSPKSRAPMTTPPTPDRTATTRSTVNTRSALMAAAREANAAALLKARKTEGASTAAAATRRTVSTQTVRVQTDARLMTKPLDEMSLAQVVERFLGFTIDCTNVLPMVSDLRSLDNVPFAAALDAGMTAVTVRDLMEDHEFFKHAHIVHQAMENSFATQFIWYSKIQNLVGDDEHQRERVGRVLPMLLAMVRDVVAVMRRTHPVPNRLATRADIAAAMPPMQRRRVE